MDFSSCERIRFPDVNGKREHHFDWVVPTLQDTTDVRRTCIGLAFYRTHIITFVKNKHELLIFDRRDGKTYPGPSLCNVPKLDGAPKPDYVALVYSREINCIFAISRMARGLVRFNFTTQLPEKDTIADPSLIALEELTVACEVQVAKMPWCIAMNSKRQLFTTSDNSGTLNVYDENLKTLDSIVVPDAVAFTGLCFDGNDDGYFVDRTAGCVYLLEYGPGRKATTQIMGLKAGGREVEVVETKPAYSRREWTGRSFEYGRTLHAICASRTGDVYVTCSRPGAVVYQISRTLGESKTDPASYRIRAIVLSDFSQIGEIRTPQNPSVYSLGLLMDNELNLYLSIFYAEKLLRIDSRYCHTFTKELMAFCLGWNDENSVLRTDLLLEIIVYIGATYLVAGSGH